MQQPNMMPQSSVGTTNFNPSPTYHDNIMAMAMSSQTNGASNPYEAYFSAPNFENTDQMMGWNPSCYFPYFNPTTATIPPPDNNLNTVDDQGRKKKKKPRILFKEHQLKALESVFNRKKFPTLEERKKLSEQIGLSQQQVKIWFQNRRYKTKLADKEAQKNMTISPCSTHSLDKEYEELPAVSLAYDQKTDLMVQCAPQMAGMGLDYTTYGQPAHWAFPQSYAPPFPAAFPKDEQFPAYGLRNYDNGNNFPRNDYVQFKKDVGQLVDPNMG